MYFRSTDRRWRRRRIKMRLSHQKRRWTKYCSSIQFACTHVYTISVMRSTIEMTSSSKSGRTSAHRLGVQGCLSLSVRLEYNMRFSVMRWARFGGVCDHNSPLSERQFEKCEAVAVQSKWRSASMSTCRFSVRTYKTAISWWSLFNITWSLSYRREGSGRNRSIDEDAQPHMQHTGVDDSRLELYDYYNNQGTLPK
jgi:hypothetical protein